MCPFIAYCITESETVIPGLIFGGFSFYRQEHQIKIPAKYKRFTLTTYLISIGDLLELLRCFFFVFLLKENKIGTISRYRIEGQGVWTPMENNKLLICFLRNAWVQLLLNRAQYRLLGEIHWWKKNKNPYWIFYYHVKVLWQKQTQMTGLQVALDETRLPSVSHLRMTNFKLRESVCFSFISLAIFTKPNKI